MDFSITERSKYKRNNSKTLFSNLTIENNDKLKLKLQKKIDYLKSNYFSNNKFIYLNTPIIKPKITSSFINSSQFKKGIFSPNTNNYNINNSSLNSSTIKNQIPIRKNINLKQRNKIIKIKEEEDLYKFSIFKFKQ